MHERDSHPGLQLELSPSRTLCAAILLAHGAAAAGAFAALGGVAGLALAGALVLLGLGSARVHALLGAPRSVRRIELRGDEARLWLASGAALEARAHPRRYVSRWLVTLSLRPPARRSLLITADMLERDAFRRLRVWALWGRLAATGGAAARNSAAGEPVS